MSTSWNALLPGSKRTQEVLIVSVFSLLALVTRAYGIWEWPITGDENFSIAMAEQRATGVIGSAYYALVLGSQAIFGATKWSARLPSVLLGVLSIPAFYLMCRSIFDRKAATIGCIFLILSDWHLYYSQIARFYSGVFIFGALSYYFYYVALVRKSYRYLFFFFVSSTLAVMFHATAIFVVVSCGVYSVFRVLSLRGGDKKFSKRMAWIHIIICTIIAVLSFPKFINIAMGWGVNFSGLSFNSLRTVLGVVENMGVAVFVSSLMGIVYLYLEENGNFTLSLILITIPLLSVLFFSVALPPSRPRYMFYSMPMFFALSAFFCSSLSSISSEKFGLDIGVVIVISSIMFVGFASYYSGRTSLGVREPANFVESKYESGDNVVVFGPSVKRNFESGIDVNEVESKALWKQGLIHIAEKKGRTWIIVDTYRTAPLRRDLEAWLMENASLKWRKEETRFDYTQRGYEVWLEAEE